MLLRHLAAGLRPARTIVSISGYQEFVVPARKTAALKTPASSSAVHPANPGRLTLGQLRRQRELDSDVDSAAAEEGDGEGERGARGRRGSRGAPITYNSQLASGLTVRLVKMRIVKNMTKNGKYARFSAMVAVGNGRGGVGIAHAKSINAVDAIAKATRSATRTMQYYDRFQDRTLFHDDIVKFKATLLYLRPAAEGSGRRCHPAIAEMSKCMGIHDISAKVHGSQNPINVAQAFLVALGRQKTPESVARESGLRIVDVLKVYQQGCEELSRTLRSERYSTAALKKELSAQQAAAQPYSQR